jgi:hypothetical protein
MTGAFAGGVASPSHLSLEQEECKIANFKEPQKIGIRKKLFCNIYVLKRVWSSEAGVQWSTRF